MNRACSMPNRLRNPSGGSVRVLPFQVEKRSRGKPGGRAMGQQAAVHALVRPVEHVDAERAFAGLQAPAPWR